MFSFQFWNLVLVNMEKGFGQLTKSNCSQQFEEVVTSIKSLKLLLTFWQKVKHQFVLEKINVILSFVYFQVNWPPFEWIIIITIMANCVVMALDDKLSNNDKSIMSIKLVR